MMYTTLVEEHNVYAPNKEFLGNIGEGLPELADVNKWADFWYFEIGVIVTIPRLKDNRTSSRVKVEWRQYQNKEVDEKTFDQCKAGGAFKNGMAIITGKIWRGKSKCLYLTAIDSDNLRVIEETYFMQTNDLLPASNAHVLVIIAEG